MCLNTAIRTKIYKILGNDSHSVTLSLKKYYRDYHVINMANLYYSFRINIG